MASNLPAPKKFCSTETSLIDLESSLGCEGLKKVYLVYEDCEL